MDSGILGFWWSYGEEGFFGYADRIARLVFLLFHFLGFLMFFVLSFLALFFMPGFQFSVMFPAICIICMLILRLTHTQDSLYLLPWFAAMNKLRLLLFRAVVAL